MDLKKINIDGKPYNVVSESAFKKNIDFYNNSMTAIEHVEEGQEFILPIRAMTDTRPGYTKQGVLGFYNLPETEEDKIKYSRNNDKFVDFSNCTSMADTIKKQEMVRDIEREIITNPDSITVPNVSALDSPEMRGLKEAIIMKNIDIDKYQGRFGDNFPNDKRLLKQHNITQKMLKRMVDNLDIKVTMIFEDVDSNVPNPMGKKIIINLSESGDEEE